MIAFYKENANFLAKNENFTKNSQSIFDGDFCEFFYYKTINKTKI